MRTTAPRSPSALDEQLAREVRRWLATVEATHKRAKTRMDEKTVHDLRVAGRRARLLLTFSRPGHPTLAERLQDLDDVVAPVRDLDTARLVLRATRSPIPPSMPLAIKAERARVVQRVRRLLDSYSFPRAERNAIPPEASDVPASLRRLQASVEKRAKRARKRPSDDTVHAARIALRQERYLSEALQPLAPKPAARHLGAIRKPLAALSHTQDYSTARAVVRRLAVAARSELSRADRFAAGRVDAALAEAHAKAREKALRRLKRTQGREWQRLVQTLVRVDSALSRPPEGRARPPESPKDSCK